MNFEHKPNAGFGPDAHNFIKIPLDGVPNLAYDNATNRITTTGYEYDAAGNQIKAPDASGNSLLLEYDAANRVHIIKKESDSSYVQAFQYGSTNARVMDMDYGYGYLKIFASVGGTTLAEYTEFTHTVPTWTKSNTYLGARLLASVSSNGSGGEYFEYNHPDKLSTRLITNAAGSYEQAHLPFGTALNAESTGSTANRFTSYDRSNSTGFDYALNRTYDPKQGRFTQVDPIGMKAVSLDAPQTLNLYSYCGNDPINFTDPSGLFFGRFFRWLGRLIMSLFRSGVARRIAIRFAVSYAVSGFNFGVAIRSVIPDILSSIGLNPNPLLTPSWNPNLAHPLASAGVGALKKYIIYNLMLLAEPYLLFDGCRLTYFDNDGNEGESWGAGSGKIDSTSADENRADYGPLPSTATYTVGPAETQYYIQGYKPIIAWMPSSIPGVPVPTVVAKVPIYQPWAATQELRNAWGHYRTRLRLRSGTTGGRDGFYLHGGKVCGSIGCIDLTGENDRFHTWLKKYGRRIMVKVNYTCSPW